MAGGPFSTWDLAGCGCGVYNVQVLGCIRSTGYPNVLVKIYQANSDGTNSGNLLASGTTGVNGVLSGLSLPGDGYYYVTLTGTSSRFKVFSQIFYLYSTNHIRSSNNGLQLDTVGDPASTFGRPYQCSFNFNCLIPVSNTLSASFNGGALGTLTFQQNPMFAFELYWGGNVPGLGFITFDGNGTGALQDPSGNNYQPASVVCPGGSGYVVQFDGVSNGIGGPAGALIITE